jgi:hypothetical protein
MAATSAPQVMDALDLLGLRGGGGGDSEDDELLDGDGEEVFAENNTGTAEDRAFDAVIGVIEGIMISPAFMQLLTQHVAAAAAPDSMSEHDRYLVYKAYLAAIEAFVDAAVAAALPEREIEKLAALVAAREAEVSDDVIDLVNGACISYQAFEALWRARPAAN